MKTEARDTSFTSSNCAWQLKKQHTANDHRKGNLTENLILHAFTLLPALKIQCFYWLTAQQSECVCGKTLLGFFQTALFMIHDHM